MYSVRQNQSDHLPPDYLDTAYRSYKTEINPDFNKNQQSIYSLVMELATSPTQENDSGLPENGSSHDSSRENSSTENLGPRIDKMTLVSPPFTPSQSAIDLVHPRQHEENDPGTPKRVQGRPQPESWTQNGLSSRLREQLNDLPTVSCESRARIPTTSGTEMFLHVYRNNIDKKEHLAIVFGDSIHSKSLFAPRPGETEQDRMTRGAYYGKLYPGRTSSQDSSATSSEKRDTRGTLVRIHSECYTGETAWSARCDCGEQLDEAARLMANEGYGVIVYLRQEGRGIGLGEKLKAYNLQDLGADTVQANLMLRHPADARSFSMATAILLDLGLNEIRLLTNNPDKIAAVEGKNKEIKVTERVPMIPLSWQNKGGFRSKEVDKYLATKVERMGHLLNIAHAHKNDL